MKLRTITIITAVLICGNLLHAKENAIQCANLIYGGTHTSRCFSDQFLSSVQQKTTIPTERRFKSVKLAADELFDYPFVVMTGEDSFSLTKTERDNLKRYLENGGFLLASSGCSSSKWNDSFRREIDSVLGKDSLEKIPMTHPVFSTVNEIKELKLHRGASEAYLEGVKMKNKLVVIYSHHGLNDTAHTEGCCCCGGNEIENSMDVNVNILAYALLH